MRFFTTELNKFKQLKHGYKKQPLHYGDYLQLLTTIVPSYTPSVFFFDFHNIKTFYKSCQNVARIPPWTGNHS